jgi:hypothetical protein
MTQYCPKCNRQLNSNNTKGLCYRCSAKTKALPAHSLRDQLAARDKTIAGLIAAIEGGLVLARCYFDGQGRDPSNNDNYCRMVDALAESARSKP